MEHISNSLVENKINQFSEMIYENNKKFNLTGFKTLEDVRSKLVKNSIVDLSRLNVPRGTSVVDMGTGSGVPGVVLAILNENLSFFLLDSNSKKCGFIKDACIELGLNNVTVHSVRIEEYARENRGRFDCVVSRAFAPVYYNFELALPMLKKEGVLYIYSHYDYSDLSKGLRRFCEQLGGCGYKTPFNEGITVKKTKKTPLLYPRKFPVIKREAQLIPETA
ncbi:MAG: 16S rRNA (guanine(527)-N(7))-methyltransferase RsmG [Spirochaetes bacterium]|nr:16S rRNA (guanine(527)-N(7))-methyltransferase RsmG [Spirochaetota bacterium]